MKILLMSAFFCFSFMANASDTVTNCSTAFGDYKVSIIEKKNELAVFRLMTDDKENGRVIRFTKLGKATNTLLSGTSYFAQAFVKTNNGEEDVTGTIALVCNRF